MTTRPTSCWRQRTGRRGDPPHRGVPGPEAGLDLDVAGQPGDLQQGRVEVTDLPMTIRPIEGIIDIPTLCQSRVFSWEENERPLAATAVMTFGRV